MIRAHRRHRHMRTYKGRYPHEEAKVDPAEAIGG